MYLSIVIPAFNEAKRIGPTLEQVYHFLKGKNYDYEVILVDDGSKDETVLEGERSSLARSGKLKILKNGVNKGKGYSVKQGILSSKGDFVLFSDADLSAPIGEIDKLFGYVEKGFDVVIGSRSLKDSQIRIHQPWFRERMGKIFNFFVRILIAQELVDTQCGFKLFKGAVAREIASLLRIDGFCFDVELLYLARKKGYRIKEAGIIWDNSFQSKVRVVVSSLNMFRDLFRIKNLHKCDF